MELKIEDLSLFKAIFRGITKFTDVARFDVSHNGIRIRSIDPHDFCYIDIKLQPSFFEGFSWDSEKFTSEADIGKLRNVISKITRDKIMYLDIRKKNIALNFVNSGKTRYELEWLDEEQFNLPEPQNLDYDAQITIPSTEFLEIVKEASAVSREIYFGVEGGKFVVGSHEGGFSYHKTMDLSGQVFESFKNKIPRKNVKSWTILDYLSTISEMVKQCGDVKLSLSDNLPLRIDLSYRGRGNFVFIISNQVLSVTEQGTKDKTEFKKISPNVTNFKPPQISVTKFPKFLESIKNGMPAKNLLHSRYETENGNYARLGELLKFTTKRNGVVYLSTEGKDFLASLEKRSGKTKLNKKLKENIPEYKYMLKLLSNTPQSFNDIVNSLKRSKKYSMKNKEDVLLLLGLATWCNSIDRRMGLYYYGK
jgi:proliferating cell nuclear antigen